MASETDKQLLAGDDERFVQGHGIPVPVVGLYIQGLLDQIVLVPGGNEHIVIAPIAGIEAQAADGIALQGYQVLRRHTNGIFGIIIAEVIGHINAIQHVVGVVAPLNTGEDGFLVFHQLPILPV